MTLFLGPLLATDLTPPLLPSMQMTMPTKQCFTDASSRNDGDDVPKVERHDNEPKRDAQRGQPFCAVPPLGSRNSHQCIMQQRSHRGEHTSWHVIPPDERDIPTFRSTASHATLDACWEVGCRWRRRRHVYAAEFEIVTRECCRSWSRS